MQRVQPAGSGAVCDVAGINSGPLVSTTARLTRQCLGSRLASHPDDALTHLLLAILYVPGMTSLRPRRNVVRNDPSTGSRRAKARVHEKRLKSTGRSRGLGGRAA